SFKLQASSFKLQASSFKLRQNCRAGETRADGAKINSESAGCTRPTACDRPEGGQSTGMW
ncbi:hypothetical protein, partial [Pseudomonas lopnurensis]|uniref:hypothetical protein n=1 Tax=Pseudomonas lopnurensis TaxID=1477517 RepID=UPI0028A644F5